MRNCILGLDTSNYTTSVCAIDVDEGTMLAQARKLLPVKFGDRGLRQSEALFLHVQRLPYLVDEMMGEIGANTGGQEVRWVGVGVSTRPRPTGMSYMPVFTAGLSFANSFGRALGIPVVNTSHQEGHVGAADYFIDLPMDVPFLAVHISGGTSDVFFARRTRFGYAIEMVGEGADLHAGQFVDRVGVALGCPFPAGPALEKLAEDAPPDTAFRIGGQVRGSSLSFSGPCSAALRAIEQGIEPSVVAYAVEQCIANSVTKAIDRAIALRPEVTECVIVGGVASNQAIKKRLIHRLRILHERLNLVFAPPKFSSDNALGVAFIATGFLCGK